MPPKPLISSWGRRPKPKPPKVETPSGASGRVSPVTDETDKGKQNESNTLRSRRRRIHRHHGGDRQHGSARPRDSAPALLRNVGHMGRNRRRIWMAAIQGERPMLDKRIEAAERGETIYAGTTCRSCGKAERYVSSNACVECQRTHRRTHRAKAREAINKAKAGHS